MVTYEFDDQSPLPRAGIDPITTSSAALSVIRATIEQPLIGETIVCVLDDLRRGRSLLSVTGTDHDGDAVLAVVDLVASVADRRHGFDADALIVASVRPRAPVGPADVDRWLEASDRCEQAGLELLEWFVLSESPDGHSAVDADSQGAGTHGPTGGRSDDHAPVITVVCPRDLLGERPRW